MRILAPGGTHLAQRGPPLGLYFIETPRAPSPAGDEVVVGVDREIALLVVLVPGLEPVKLIEAGAVLAARRGRTVGVHRAALREGEVEAGALPAAELGARPHAARVAAIGVVHARLAELT